MRTSAQVDNLPVTIVALASPLTTFGLVDRYAVVDLSLDFLIVVSTIIVNPITFQPAYRYVLVLVGKRIFGVDHLTSHRCMEVDGIFDTNFARKVAPDFN